jgi:hypothetical protein
MRALCAPVRVVLQVGISMVQIISSANSVYSIPWPDSFSAFLDLLKVFMIDIITITKVCTR